jgi:hypothetical protein
MVASRPPPVVPLSSAEPLPVPVLPLLLHAATAVIPAIIDTQTNRVTERPFICLTSQENQEAVQQS